MFKKNSSKIPAKEKNWRQQFFVFAMANMSLCKEASFTKQPLYWLSNTVDVCKTNQLKRKHGNIKKVKSLSKARKKMDNFLTKLEKNGTIKKRANRNRNWVFVSQKLNHHKNERYGT